MCIAILVIARAEAAIGDVADEEDAFSDDVIIRILNDFSGQFCIKKNISYFTYVGPSWSRGNVGLGIKTS